MKLLHIKRTNTWLNNANEWILPISKCNHDLKFTATSSKKNKSLIYYIIDYISKIYIYTSHIYYLFQIVVLKTKTINENPNNNYDSINKSQHFFIHCLNTIRSQQEISTTRVIIY
jgi:hypothetical protein